MILLIILRLLMLNACIFIYIYVYLIISPKYTMHLKKKEGYFLDKASGVKTGRLCPTRAGPSENIMIHKKKQRRYNIRHLSVYQGRERASK